MWCPVCGSVLYEPLNDSVYCDDCSYNSDNNGIEDSCCYIQCNRLQKCDKCFDDE